MSSRNLVRWRNRDAEPDDRHRDHVDRLGAGQGPARRAARARGTRGTGGSEGGYRAFLIDCRPEAANDLARALSAGLADFGFDPVATGDALASYAEVQNTYLSTFETLGGLGLLLGTFGVVAVLLRNVVDYRGEFAMMLAMGFRRGQLVRMVALENGALLAAGVIVGTVSALVAVAPQLADRASDVGWASLAAIIAATLAVGLVSCAAAASAAMRGDLLGALRSE